MVNHEDESLISAKALSENLNIPYKFLTKIMTELVSVGFIESIESVGSGRFEACGYFTFKFFCVFVVVFASLEVSGASSVTA